MRPGGIDRQRDGAGALGQTDELPADAVEFQDAGVVGDVDVSGLRMLQDGAVDAGAAVVLRLPDAQQGRAGEARVDGLGGQDGGG